MDNKLWEEFTPPGSNDVLKGMRSCMGQLGYPRLPKGFLDQLLNLNMAPQTAPPPPPERISIFKGFLRPICRMANTRAFVSTELLLQAIKEPIFGSLRMPGFYGDYGIGITEQQTHHIMEDVLLKLYPMETLAKGGLPFILHLEARLESGQSAVLPMYTEEKAIRFVTPQALGGKRLDMATRYGQNDLDPVFQISHPGGMKAALKDQLFASRIGLAAKAINSAPGGLLAGLLTPVEDCTIGFLASSLVDSIMGFNTEVRRHTQVCALCVYACVCALCSSCCPHIIYGVVYFCRQSTSCTCCTCSFV